MGTADPTTPHQFYVSYGSRGVRRGRRGDKGHRFGARNGSRYLVFVRLLKISSSISMSRNSLESNT